MGSSAASVKTEEEGEFGRKWGAAMRMEARDRGNLEPGEAEGSPVAEARDRATSRQGSMLVGGGRGSK
jgi:hypothetical protein